MDWKTLKATDFYLANPDWMPSLKASVTFGGADVSLTIDGACEALGEHASCFISLLDGWQRHREDTARLTQNFVQAFLPGRVVAPSELSLWGATLYTDQGRPQSGCFFYRVAGDYESPRYQLDQFDHRSVIELCCPIDSGTADWSSRDISATNDFD